MGVGNRPATCASCGKRLTYKQWYYRNGKHFCKKRCWVTEQAKAAKEGTPTKKTGSAQAGEGTPAATPAKEAPAT